MRYYVLCNVNIVVHYCAKVKENMEGSQQGNQPAHVKALPALPHGEDFGATFGLEFSKWSRQTLLSVRGGVHVPPCT